MNYSAAQRSIGLSLCVYLTWTMNSPGIAILLEDNRSISSSLSEFLDPDRQTFSQETSPSSSLEEFFASTPDFVESWHSFDRGVQASQDSTITPNGFSASGEAFVELRVNEYGSSGSASASGAAESLFEVTFELAEVHTYQISGMMFNEGLGSPYAGQSDSLSLTNLGDGTVIEFDSDDFGIINQEGSLPVGTYLFSAVVGANVDLLNPEFAEFELGYDFEFRLEEVPESGATSILLGIGLLSLFAARSRLVNRTAGADPAVHC